MAWRLDADFVPLGGVQGDPALKIGRQWRFRESELRRWLEDRKASSTRLLNNLRSLAAMTEDVAIGVDQ